MSQGKLTDEWRLPFGSHEGKRLEDVPASYLLWIYQNLSKLRPDLKEYIEENMEILNEEAKKENPSRPSKGS